MSQLNRRRFLCITAAAIGLPMQAAAGQSAVWRGRALGAPASLRLAGVGPSEAAPIFSMVERELARLENIFSLYRDTSEIRRLNATGVLRAPSQEFLEVLSLSGSLNTATGGAFDPTVQPLWPAGSAVGAPPSAIGWQHLRFDGRKITFAHPDGVKMGLTLNGIAQGYITDKIADLLGNQGLANVLVDFGEIIAMGKRPAGGHWQVGVAAPEGKLVKRMTLADRALATSAPLMPLGGQNPPSPHIFSPTANLKLRHRLVSVSAPTAALADGLSTAFCLLPEAQIESALLSFPDARIEVLHPLI